jgi:hypothetical protein
MIARAHQLMMEVRQKIIFRDIHQLITKMYQQYSQHQTIVTDVVTKQQLWMLMKI